MKTWTATATAQAQPAAVLDVLTDPDAAARWAPVPFDVEDDRRLTAGRTVRVSGRLAGRRVGFDVLVHSADVHGFALTARGPVGFDVDYRIVGTTLSEGFPDGTLAPHAVGSEVHASVSVRPTRGLAGRLLAEATTALLNAGALDQTLQRLVDEARESALWADLPATRGRRPSRRPRLTREAAATV
ncbi:SRPBCC family protein [Solirubrobacter sp. CPCC 204708]|uniref:SRPBCC family protein n=1 Tax=Solirubrobacter deserti TaxID=2282478 RepID=A0ABT4RL01_9ACTN|nr:SRPBCC family protein [Solirubrobacter deserti]MBE2319043.1 SRPBCC family protein [Solirubrobacter deserti]MDA0139233.1 SRPBCC family protein [Solirubrobacter deserti]